MPKKIAHAPRSPLFCKEGLGEILYGKIKNVEKGKALASESVGYDLEKFVRRDRF